MQISGIYSINKKKNRFLSCKAQSYRDENVEIYVVNGTNNQFAEKLASLYLEKGVSCVNDVDDMFLAVVYDSRDGSIHIFADVTNSILNLYYTVAENRLIYSTSLKWLLLESGIERELNFKGAKAFLANGYVFGKETLLQNIYKLQFGCELTTESNVVLQKRYPYKLKKIAKKTAKREFIRGIQAEVANCLDKNEKLFLPLSGGFDSNMLLDALRKTTTREINAISIGSSKGKSELETVKENVAYLKNVELHTSLVDDTFYENLSDIVWRLEGFVFESGVFLQYALARCARECGAKELICGEGSDEVQNKYYYESLKRVLDGKALENEKFFTYADPFIGTNMLILKKSSLMLHSFGIIGKYPFKSKRIAELAIALASLNGTNKKYYKKLCKKEFLPQIANNLKTTGGTTGNATAINEEQARELVKAMSENPLIQKILNYEYDIRVSPRTKRLRRRQCIEHGIAEIKNFGIKKGFKKVAAFDKKQDLAKLIKQAWIVIFEELFISGKYDANFYEESAPLKTTSIVRGEI